MVDETWKPKTEIGRMVKDKSLLDIDQVLDKGKRILEAEITETLLDVESELLLVGQSKGKFGGGQRRAFRQTQKKTREGNKPKFATIAIVGDKNGHVGIGYGKSKETIPAREKAFRKAKLNIFKIRRGCGSWECKCDQNHSVPFKVIGRGGSVTIEILPAPRGLGLVAGKKIQNLLKLAGIKDAWTTAKGSTTTMTSTSKAVLDCLRRTFSQG